LLLRGKLLIDDFPKLSTLSSIKISVALPGKLKIPAINTILQTGLETYNCLYLNASLTWTQYSFTFLVYRPEFKVAFGTDECFNNLVADD
jgi:hypothetical protein